MKTLNLVEVSVPVGGESTTTYYPGTSGVYLVNGTGLAVKYNTIITHFPNFQGAYYDPAVVPDIATILAVALHKEAAIAYMHMKGNLE